MKLFFGIFLAIWVAITGMGCCVMLPPKVAPTIERDIAKEKYTSIVSIRAKAKMGPGFIVATGYALDKERILTAAHFCVDVLENQIKGILEDDISLIYVNDNEENTEIGGATIETLDERVDLCVLKRKYHGLKPLKLVENYMANTHPMDKVQIIGGPMGIFPVHTEGRVVAVVSDVLDDALDNYLIVSASVFAGNSGGPILNEKGEVIGIVVIRMARYEHITIAVHADSIKKFLREEKIPYGK